MRKSFALVLAVALCMVMFAGCGKSEAPAAETQAAEEKTEAAAEVTEAEPVGESTVSFGLDETVTVKDLCEMSGLYVEVLDDDAKAEGWYYYYTDTDQSPAKAINWEIDDEDYTTAEVLFTVKNITDEPQKFGDRVTAKMYYQEDGTSEIEEFEGTVFQQNPDQVDENGEIMMWSTKPVEIEAGESTNVSFRFDIPKDVYEKVYATAIGEETEITETCEFDFGDGTTYVVDLAETLIAASKYEY